MTRPVWTHAFEYWAFQYRRSWYATFVSGVITPLLFLVAIGAGLGALMQTRMHGLGDHGYFAFLAPGLLAWTAMRTAVGESTGPVTSAATWRGTYDAMLAAPLRARDAFVGHLTWIALRVTMVSAAFLIAATALRLTYSWLAVLAVPAAALTGIAIAAPTMAFSVRQTNFLWFDLVLRMVVVPLSLFSGTFFPVQVLPEAARVAAYVTPLWQGVALCRSFTVGQVSAGSALVHVLYLSLLASAGIAVAVFNFRRRLEE